MKNKIPKVLEDSILMYKDFLEKYKDNEKPEKSIIELFYVKSIKEIAQNNKVDFYYKKYFFNISEVAAVLIFGDEMIYYGNIICINITI